MLKYFSPSLSPPSSLLSLPCLLHPPTLSFPMWPLCGYLVLGIHIFPNNGPIEIILRRKLIYYVPPIHFACSIMYIGPLVDNLWCRLIADFVREKLTLRFSPNFGQNSIKSYRKVKDIKIKLILIKLQSCRVPMIKFLD